MRAERRHVACGVDIGSTNSKVVALDGSGLVVGRASRPTPRNPQELSIDADALFAAVEEMVVEVCGGAYEVHALCSAGVGEDGVLVDSRLRPLLQAMAWFDPRRQGIFHALKPHLNDDASFDTASDPVRTIVGWKWSAARVPSGAASSWVALADLPGVFWSRRVFLSDTLASRTAAWRSGDRQWAADRVELTLGGAGLLPPVVCTGDIVGTVTSTRLHAAGVLASDAITVAGGHDHPIGGWGVDQMVPGSVLDSMGTAEVIVAQSPLPRMQRRDHVDVAPGIRSGGTTLLRVEELARNVEWASRDPAVGAHIRALLKGDATPLPVLSSGYFLPGRRGGGQPRYSIDAPHDAPARASAVLGALAQAGRDAVAAIRSELPGPTEVRLTGGWALSPGWVEIKTIVNGYRTIPILEPEVTAVSAALLAARARGWSPDAALAFSSRPPKPRAGPHR